MRYQDDMMMTRSSRKKKKRNRNIKIAVVILIEILLLSVIIVCTWALDKISNVHHVELPSGETLATIEYVDPTYAEIIKEGYTNYVVFGVEARDPSQLISGTNSDVIIIVSINNATSEIKMASIYRDTYVRRSDGEFGKITGDLTRNGAYKAMETISKSYDIELDGFICVNWAIIAKVVNRLGGLELDIKENMMSIKVDGVVQPYINGLITEIVESTGIPSTHIQQTGVQLCDGVQTVAYCRLRKQDSDFMRTERQREVISKMLTKVKSASLPTLDAIVDDVLSSIATSVPVDDLMGLIPLLADMQIAGSTGFPFQHKSGAGYFSWAVVPVNLEANVVQLHNFFFGAEDYQVSEYVKTLSEELRIRCGFDENFNFIGVPE